MSLKTDYLDAIPAAGAGTLRKYTQINNADGTVSFQDVTEYSQVGDKAQASVFNGIGTEVNGKVDSATLGGAAVTKSGTTLQLPAYPTSLPANGGNAATLGGKTESQLSVSYANSAGSAPANGGTATYATYSTHAVGSGGAALRNNTASASMPSGGSDGDGWDYTGS